jgi:hypothetical protein
MKLLSIFLLYFGRTNFCSMPYEKQFCTRGIELYLDIGVGYFNMLLIKGKESKTNNKELALQSKGWMCILLVPGILIKNEYSVNKTTQCEEKGVFTLSCFVDNILILY